MLLPASFPPPPFRRRRMQVSLLFSIRRRLLLRLPSSLSPPPFRSLEGAAAKKVWTEEAHGGSRGEGKERELATGFFPSSPLPLSPAPRKKEGKREKNVLMVISQKEAVQKKRRRRGYRGKCSPLFAEGISSLSRFNFWQIALQLRPLKNCAIKSLLPLPRSSTQLCKPDSRKICKPGP